ncbi:YebC/PmpR family DNA-binding transcriptional regulator [Caldicoprobacter algeriensis]|uniref:YebC/PmpR family DNA-binding transcriptional regulator n=1 Tax=Caldicoprobacter algeriensis TaxID=699281 RepID=UPI00207A3B6E|nr:YebC/PmpR family DNA-binding transcriptional regulator [Caldicoprobacter algeriensis]MCM8900111.1 YebC/PmpR family DNA-binding transcriptional regulator [Caldicoprobacter algeriensis]
MAGHSKWANIKHKKEKTDAQKGKLFTKLGREIAVAVKEGGSNPETNPRLRDAIAKAKAANMPSENIMRTIKKAAGELETVNYEEVVYEGYGPNGVAIIVEALTDNRNRTASDIRHIFERHGGNLGAAGCVAWMFDRKGLLVIEKDENTDEEELMLQALEAGAEDISDEGDVFEIITAPSDFSNVREQLEKAGYSFVTAEIAMIPQNYVEVNEEASNKVMNLIEKLEDHDDVQNVFTNLKME